MLKDVLLSQKAYSSLKKKIINNIIKPGTKLSEATIANQMGISRTPVREALKELVHNGFATMNPNMGIVVNNFSIEDFIEVMQLRGALEGLAARIAAAIISKEEIKELENCINKMKICCDENNILKYSEVDRKFHEIILNACKNKRLTRFHKILKEQIHGYRIKFLNMPGGFKYSFNSHQQILEAFKKNNLEEAESLSQLHIKDALKKIVDYNISNI